MKIFLCGCRIKLFLKEKMKLRDYVIVGNVTNYMKKDPFLSGFTINEEEKNRQEKGKVCFGSGLERKTLEADVNGLVSLHARQNMRQDFPNLGPGSYEISKLTSALSSVLYRPTSKLGTVLGGRRAQRDKTISYYTPGPGYYDIPTTFPDSFKTNCAPFNSFEERRKEFFTDIPGVGIYNVSASGRRNIPFSYSFGGKKCIIPAVKMKCGPFNYDTCNRCKKSPEGDYWSLKIFENQPAENTKQLEPEGTFLCRPCYEIEKKENKMFTKAQIKFFEKVRDCSKVHFHNGTTAKLFLASPKNIKKLKEKEAYLSLFFP